MKWYADKTEPLQGISPIISVCGDDCAVCPRYLAQTEEELHETAVFWYKAGWRDHVVSNEEIKCTGCGSRRECSFKLLTCTKEHGVGKCSECPDFQCEKVKSIFVSMEKSMSKCRMACDSEVEFNMLVRAFFEKEKNMR